MDKSDKTLYIVVPCYNEQEVLPETNSTLLQILTDMISTGIVAATSRLCFVDDGSKDDTWALIRQYCSESGLVCGIKLSRNRGQQNALMAGLMTVREHCDMVITLDADLQDDPALIPQFVEKYVQGCDIVYGVRSDRSSDGGFKRSSAQLYYKLLSLLGVEVIYNHADYRLMSRRALDSLAQYGEINLFIRGIVPQLGYKTDVVTYPRGVRSAGESKYPLSKMLALAAEGVTAFSVRPLRMVQSLSLIIMAVVVVLWIVQLIIGMTMSWAILLSLWTVCGLIMGSVGLLGEYVGRTYMEVKHRPRYFVSEFINQ